MGREAYILQNTTRSVLLHLMPFGLTNAGAIYQRAMNTIFYEHICKTIQCYVDDIVVKSRNKGDHESTPRGGVNRCTANLVN